MTDKPEIKVGQRWVTREGLIVRILSKDAIGTFSVAGQFEESFEFDGWCPDGFAYPDERDRPDGNDLISLAPSTVKREVALYRCDGCVLIYDAEPGERLPADLPNEYRISEPRTIEFTLLPGESAE